MLENFQGLIKILGISLLLAALWIFFAAYDPAAFLSSSNLENLLRRTALYGVLGIGVAFVIISSGIDLSIGSLVCLSACLLATFLHVDYVALDSTDVLNVDANNKTLVIRQAAGLESGDFVWYDAGRRNRSLLTVTEVVSTKSLGNKRQLIVTGELKKDFESTDGSAVAKISKAFPIVEVQSKASEEEGTVVKFNSGFPSLASRDRISFVHPTSSSREAIVASSWNSEVALQDTISGLDTNFVAVPIRRQPRMSIPVAMAAVVAIALGLGLIHGLLITRLSLPPFVVTLCGLLIYRGVSRSLTNDETVGFIEYSDSLGRLSSGRWEIIGASADGWPGENGFGVPYVFLLFVALTVLAMIALNLTVWGRHLLAVGQNEEATRYSGINTKRITMMTYLICAGLAGVGGILHGIDSNSISPAGFGTFFELDAIAAAVLGGCSLRGGQGSILGVVVGTALMQTLHAAIVLLKISDEMELTIIGVVILLGVLGDELLHRTAAAMKRRSA